MISIRGIMLLAALSLGACGQLPSAPQVSLPAPYSENGVRVVVDGLYEDGYGNVTGITGTATNELGKDLVTCMMTLDVLDASGVKVSSAIASTAGLRAGQTWRFQATFMNPYSVQFKTVAPGQMMVMPARAN